MLIENIDQMKTDTTPICKALVMAHAFVSLRDSSAKCGFRLNKDQFQQHRCTNTHTLHDQNETNRSDPNRNKLKRKQNRNKMK